MDAASPVDPAKWPPRRTPVGELRHELQELSTDLNRFDAKLESWEARGNIYPSYDTAAWAGDIAHGLSDAARGYELLSGNDGAPQRDLADGLHRGALQLSRVHGKLGMMAERRITFGSGWGSTLNGVVRDVEAALASLNRGADRS